jgi:hypothetical protein
MSMQLTVQLPADPVLAALGERVLDDRQVDRVEHDDRVVLHAQRERRRSSGRSSRPARSLGKTSLV